TSLVQLIGSSFTRVPERSVIVGDTSRCTYAALELRTADTIALLRRANIKPGDVVAICLSPSADLVAALPGVLACRATGLLLDLEPPAAFLRTLLRERPPRLVLSSAEAMRPGSPLNDLERTGRVVTLDPIASSANRAAMA